MEERVAIGPVLQEVMAVLRVALDEDEQEALRCLREIVIPKLEAVRNRIHCGPAFELDAYRREVEPPR